MKITLEGREKHITCFIISGHDLLKFFNRSRSEKRNLRILCKYPKSIHTFALNDDIPIEEGMDISLI